MGVKYLTYLDLSPDQRTKGAEKLRDQLRAMLLTPLLSDEQRAAILAKLDDVGKWERGEIKVTPPPGLAPKQLSVEIGETVEIIEDQS